jgi:hypothetical protein
MRPVWLALSFLIVICALAALKVSIATPAKEQALFDEATVSATTNQDRPLLKADKLDVSYVDETADKKVVRLIPILLPEATQPEPREKTTEIISRHWHEGYAGITKRSARDRRVASRLKK